MTLALDVTLQSRLPSDPSKHLVPLPKHLLFTPLFTALPARNRCARLLLRATRCCVAPWGPEETLAFLRGSKSAVQYPVSCKSVVFLSCSSRSLHTKKNHAHNPLYAVALRRR